MHIEKLNFGGMPLDVLIVGNRVWWHLKPETNGTNLVPAGSSMIACWTVWTNRGSVGVGCGNVIYRRKKSALVVGKGTTNVLSYFRLTNNKLPLEGTHCADPRRRKKSAIMERI